MNKAALLHHAIELASVGFRPIPMDARMKRPARKGWRDAATLDPDAIATAFRAASFADAVGVATGGGVFVIDLDRNHKNGEDGIAAFANLIARFGTGETLPLGPRVRTPAGGMHLYFGSPPHRRVRNRTALAPGVDVRGEGGVAMVPPSSRDGVAYRWAPDPCETPLVMAPVWLLSLIAPTEPQLQPRPRRAATPFDGDLHPYASAALRHECAAVAGCAAGARNATLFKAAASLGGLAAGGELSAEAVADALLDAAAACALLAEDGRLAVEATIASGFRHGLAAPRYVPEIIRHAR